MSLQAVLPEGYSERAGRMEDLDAAVELFNLSSVAQIGNKETTRSKVKNEWNTPGFHQETDQRVVFSPEGNLVGYTEVWSIHQPVVHPGVWGRVHPEFEGLGIGTYLLHWSEDRCRQVLDDAPPQARVSFRARCWDTYQPAKALLEGYGMQLIRQGYQMRIEMTEPPPVAKWPDSIQVRTFRPQDAEAVYRADSEAFEDHFGHLPRDFETGFAHFMHRIQDNPEFDPSIWFLAMDGDQIAGVCLCRNQSREDKNMGWVSSLAVRKPWRRRGIGLALLQHSFAAFWGRGKPRVGLGVDSENLTGALQLYQKAGMHVHRTHNLYEKELRPGIELETTNLGNRG